MNNTDMNKAGMNKADPAYAIFEPTHCQLGEGPTYDTGSDTAWWFDILGKKLIERTLSADRAIVHDLPRMASALAVVDGDRQLLICDDGLYLRKTADGTLSLLKALEADNTKTRSNDSRVHPSGAMWIGTMGIEAETGAGAIYHFHRGELQVLYSHISVPNSICFNTDGSVGHYTDTPTGKVMRVALDPANGLPVGEPAVFLDRTTDSTGSADGAVMDADGIIWIARWDGACIKAYDPTGACVETITLPAARITCPAFIGADAEQMIVTSASTGLSLEQADQQPHAGQTFLLDRPMRGKAEPNVVL